MRAAHTLLLALMMGACTVPLAQAQTPPPPDPQMRAVLDQLAALGGKPMEKLTPQQARKQPTPADAVKALLKKEGKSTDPEPVGNVQNTTVPGPAGAIPVRIYTPQGEGPFPVILYIHGGGWVIATVDTYDSSPRAMVNLTHAVVVSVEYRKAPEHKFPAAHEDCYAALQYVIKNAAKMKGDPKRVAVMGESAGGNMATAVCMMARDRKGIMPLYEVLIYPVANGNFNTPSYQKNARARPLNKSMMKWFFRNTIKSASDAHSPYLSVLNGNVKGLPPATVITAEIDPLMSEGKAYADKLEKAGIATRYKNYEGVAHEFFGMGAVVEKAKDAAAFAADGLKSAFAKTALK